MHASATTTSDCCAHEPLENMLTPFVFYIDGRQFRCLISLELKLQILVHASSAVLFMLENTIDFEHNCKVAKWDGGSAQIVGKGSSVRSHHFNVLYTYQTTQA
jgi:hypothetical protein